MQLKTILNRVHPCPGFVYSKCLLIEDHGGKRLDVLVKPRGRSRGVCSGCGQRRGGYDHLPQRRFQFVPLWGIAVFLLYSMRRVDCGRCGVTVEWVPWAQGKSHVTLAFAWFLARWAKRMSWRDVALSFGTSWQHVFQSVEMAVAWGREHMSLDHVHAIGIDELYWSRKNQFLTVVYQIDAGRKRLLWVGRKRTMKTLLEFFRWLGVPRSRELRFICSDMWKPYLRVVAKKAGQAIHVLDRFHIAAHMSKAIDEVRAKEVKALKARGLQPVLTRTRWLFLKRRENLSAAQSGGLADVVRLNLRTVRAYLLKEDFQFFWSYSSPAWAAKFLDNWCTRALRSRIDPMKKIARMLRTHRPLIINWFRARGAYSSGVVEGFNGKARVITKRAYGFRTFQGVEVALYHGLGDLPEPRHAHRF